MNRPQAPKYDFFVAVIHFSFLLDNNQKIC